MFQLSARLKHTYASYAKFVKQQKKTKKLLQKFADLYLGNGLRDLIQIWNGPPLHGG